MMPRSLLRLLLIGIFCFGLLGGLAAKDLSWDDKQLFGSFGLITSLGSNAKENQLHRPPITGEVGFQINFIGFALGILGYGIDDRETLIKDYNIHVTHIPIRILFFPTYSLPFFLDGRLHLDGRIGLGLVPTFSSSNNSVWTEVSLGWGASFWITENIRVGLELYTNFLLNKADQVGFFSPVLRFAFAF
jgi:hypothetical protein